MRLELSALADFSTLEALLKAQGVDGLLAALDEARARLAPEARWRSEDGLTLGPRTLYVLREALDLDAGCLRAWPELLFQCLYNRLRWFDAPDAAEHFTPEGVGPWEHPAAHLFALAARWRQQWEARGDTPWLEALRPLPGRFGTDDPILRHDAPVLKIAYDPSGTRLATVTTAEQRNVHIWDEATGRRLLELEGYSGLVTAVAWSADGRWLATGEGQGLTVDRRGYRVCIWDAGTGALLHKLPEQERDVLGLAFSAQGRWLAATNGTRAIRLFDTASGQVQRTLVGHQKSVRCVAFHPSGQWLACCGDDSAVCIWDVASGEQVARIIKRPFTRFLAFSPGGDWLALVSGNKKHQGITLVETRGWTRVRTVARNKRYYGVAWRGDEQLGVWGQDRVEVLDARSGHVLHLRPHPRLDSLRVADFHPAGRRYAVDSGDGTVCVRELNAPPVPELWALRDGVHALWTRPGGELCVALRADTSLVIDAQGHARTLPADPLAVPGQPWRFSPDGRWLAYPLQEGSRGGLRLLDARTLEDSRCLSAGPEPVTGVWGRERPIAFSPDGRRVAAVVEPGAVRLWHLPEGAPSWTLRGHGGEVNGVEFTGDGKYVVFHSHQDRRLWVHDVASGTRVLDLPAVPHVHALASLAPCLVVERDPGELEYVDLPTGSRRTLQTLAGPLDKVAISSDGTHVAASDADMVVRTFDTRTGALLHELPHPIVCEGEAFEQLALHADTLVTQTWDMIARFFDLTTGSKRAELEAVLKAPQVLEQPFWGSSDDRVLGLHRRLDLTPLVRFSTPLGSVRILRGGLVLGRGHWEAEHHCLYVLKLHDRAQPPERQAHAPSPSRSPDAP